MVKNNTKIPEEWKEYNIKNICNVLIGGTPARNNEDFWDTKKEMHNIWVSIRDMSNNGKYISDSAEYISDQGVKKSNVKLIPKDTLIMSFKLSIGKVAITKKELYTNEAIAAFVVKDKNLLDSNYLYYVVSGLNYDFDTAVKGKTLNKEKLLNTKIFLPSIGIQNKIAEILGAVDEEIEKINELINRSDKIKSGLMKKLFSDGIGHKGNCKRTKLGIVPVEWEVVSLSSVAKVERGKFSHRPRNDLKLYNGAIPFIQTAEVVGCNGKIYSYHQTLNDEGLKVSKMFPAGTIVLTIAANIGDTGVLQFDACFPDSLVGIKVNEQMDSIFLEFYLRTTKEYLNSIATQSAQKNINLEKLNPLLIIKPPLHEQKQIAEILFAFDNKILIYKKIKINLIQLKKGLLVELLSGKK